MNTNQILMTVFVAGLMVMVIPMNAVAYNYQTGNTELVDAINVAIGEMVSDGSYDTIYGHWFSGAVVLTDDSDANTATAYPTPTDGGTLANIISTGTITFGSDTTYPPFEMMNADGTDVIGFDAEIADGIATKLSAAYDTEIAAVMQTSDWDPIIPNLKNGDFDALLSAMTKTAERAQEIQFTRAYYTSKQGILASESSPAIEGVSDLNNASISLAVQSGTTSDIFAAASLADADLQGFDSFDKTILALNNGDVQFVLGDLPTLAYYAVENSGDNLTVVGSFGDDELFGIGVRYDDEVVADEEEDSGLPALSLVVSAGALGVIALRRRR